MAQLPDLDTISTLLTVVEARDPVGTSVSRLDEDHSILLSTQSEIVDLMSADAPAGYDGDTLRALLGRIVNAVERNREVRKEAMARELSRQHG